MCRPRHRARFRGLDILRLGVSEAPNFVDLNALRFHIADLGVMEAGAKKAGVLQKLAHGVDRNVRQARDGAHRSAFAEHGEDLGALGNGELVHVVIMNFLRHASSIKYRLTP